MNTDKKYDERYYFIRSDDVDENNPGNHPYACVCLLYDPEKNVYSRGWSFCSIAEKAFSKIRGRGLARSRAIEAMESEKTSMPFVPKDSVEHVIWAINHGPYGMHIDDCQTIYKSEYGVILTGFEKSVWED